MTDLMNKIGVGGNEFHTNYILEDIKKSPQESNLWYKLLQLGV